jgi:hypothetical protein
LDAGRKEEEEVIKEGTFSTFMPGTGAKGSFAGHRTATPFSTGLSHGPVLKGHLKFF